MPGQPTQTKEEALAWRRLVNQALKPAPRPSLLPSNSSPSSDFLTVNGSLFETIIIRLSVVNNTTSTLFPMRVLFHLVSPDASIRIYGSLGICACDPQGGVTSKSGVNGESCNNCLFAFLK